MPTDRLRMRACLVSLVMAAVPPAGAIEFETGKWEVTMNSRNPLTGEQIRKTTTECIQDSSFDPARAMMEDNSCRVLDKQERGNTFTWKLECGGGDMPVFRGEGSFVSHGSTAEGSMIMIMTMGGSTMEMSSQWHGKRIAAGCDGM